MVAGTASGVMASGLGRREDWPALKCSTVQNRQDLLRNWTGVGFSQKENGSETRSFWH